VSGRPRLSARGGMRHARSTGSAFLDSDLTTHLSPRRAAPAWSASKSPGARRGWPAGRAGGARLQDRDGGQNQCAAGQLGKGQGFAQGERGQCGGDHGLKAGHPQVRVEIFELELEQSLPGLRLGTVDLVIGDEYDSHPRPRPAGLRFTTLLEEPLKIVLPAAHPLARPGGPVAVTSLRSDIWTASAEGTGHHAMVIGTCRALGGYEPSRVSTGRPRLHDGRADGDRSGLPLAAWLSCPIIGVHPPDGGA
jgi:hypothetical protein